MDESYGGTILRTLRSLSPHKRAHMSVQRASVDLLALINTSFGNKVFASMTEDVNKEVKDLKRRAK